MPRSKPAVTSPGRLRGHGRDGGVLTKQGAGTMTMLNTAGTIVAGQTTFSIEQGTLALAGPTPWVARLPRAVGRRQTLVDWPEVLHDNS